MKVKIKKIVARVVTKEFEIGNKGDDILVRTSPERYRFGKLEGVTTEYLDNPYLQLSGNSYLLTLIDNRIPSFRKITPKGESVFLQSSEFMCLKRVDAVYVGLDNIFYHLEHKASSKYRGHADLIRKLVSKRRR